MKDLLDWIDSHDPKLAERETVKLLRRVFGEQFETIDGKLDLAPKRPPRAVQNPHDPDAHYADKRTKQWIGYKVHVTETVDPQQPIKQKCEPAEHFITEMLTVEAAQDEKAGLTETLTREQAHHEIAPRAIYTDAGYVTEHTLTQAEQNGMELLGPTRLLTRDRTIAMRSMSILTSARRFVLRASSARSAAASKILIWEPSTIASSGAINAIAVWYRNNARVPTVAGGLWSLDFAMIWSSSGAEK